MRTLQHLFACALLLGVAACAREVDGGGEESAEAPAPAAVTLADLQSLRWLEGSWRGSAEGGAPFFEAYHFIDDSTIVSRTFTDSTLSQVADSGRIALAQGSLTSRGGSTAYVATRLDSVEVHFEPLENARNAFTWTRQSPDAWTAVLRWTDESGAAQELTYQMRRLAGAPDASPDGQ